MNTLHCAHPYLSHAAAFGLGFLAGGAALLLLYKVAEHLAFRRFWS